MFGTNTQSLNCYIYIFRSDGDLSGTFETFSYALLLSYYLSNPADGNKSQMKIQSKLIG